MREERDTKGRPFPWWLDLAAAGGAALLRTLAATWRLDVRDVTAYEAEVRNGARCIFALWHARLLPLTLTHRGRHVAVLVSRHRDGELITRVVERMGYVTARGSSTRGGEEGLREMIEWAEKGHLLTITPDGPRGPAEIVKPGLVYLASRTGLPVIPVTAAAWPEWRLRSWDGFRIPRPFARVNVSYGPPIRVPPDIDRDEIERWRVEIENALVTLTGEGDARLEAST